MTKFPLSPEEVSRLCAAARIGLSALSKEADPQHMASAWVAMDRLCRWVDEQSKIEKASP